MAGESSRGLAPLVDAYDHFAMSTNDDPFDEYNELRSRCPVFRTEAHGGHYVALSYDDVIEVSSKPAEFSSVSLTIPDPPVMYVLPPLTSDPPEHQRYRGLLAAEFNPGRVRKFQDAIRDQAVELVDAFIGSGAADLATDLIFPLTARATALFLGIPKEKILTFQKHALELNTVIYAEPERFTEVRQKVLDFFAKHVQDRRECPADDFASHLFGATFEGGEVPDDLSVLLHTLLNGAAGETTASGGVGMFHIIAQRPDLRRRLLDDRELWPTAVEEFIRIISPIPGFARTAVGANRTVGDVVVPRGDKVWLDYLAANHDPAAWDRPDEVVLDRKPNRHVAFGAGIHKCPGAPLARIEMQVMLEQVLTRLPDFKVSDWSVTGLLPSATRLRPHLPVTFTPGPRLSDRSE